jgi:uncharacterized protein YjbJ (UPF0337 family)
MAFLGAATGSCWQVARSVPSRPTVGDVAMRRRLTMGLLDKAKSLLSQNKDKANDAVDKGGDFVDDKTGGKYTDKVDTAQDKAKDLIDKGDDQS